MKQSLILMTMFCSIFIFAQQSTIKFNVSFVDNAGPMKALHGVQGGPLSTNSHDADLTPYYSDASIPFVRFPYGDGFMDDYKPDAKEGKPQVTKTISRLTLGDIFPNRNADPNDEKNYNFSDIDKYVKAIKATGAEPVWQAIYDIGKESNAWLDNGRQQGKSPLEVMKWNTVIINVLRHFNNGWAKGGRWGVKYVEFINDPAGTGGYDFRFEDRNVRMERISDAKPGRAQFLNDYMEFIKTIERYNSMYGGKVKVVGPSLDADQTIKFIPEIMNKIGALKINPELLIFSYRDYNSPQKILDNASFIRKEIDRLVLGNYKGIPLWCVEWNWSFFYTPLQEKNNVTPNDISAWIMSHNIQAITLARPYWDASIIYRANRQAMSSVLPEPPNSYYFDLDSKGEPKPAFFALLAINKILKETPICLPVRGGTKENLITLLAAKSLDSKKLIILLSYWKENDIGAPSIVRYSINVSNFSFKEGNRGKLYILDKNTKTMQMAKEIIPTRGKNGEMILSDDISLWSSQLIEFEK